MEKMPKFLEEETQETFMVGSDSAEFTTPSVSHFKIPTFFLKAFRKRFDYCNDGEISGDIEKKKWLIDVASMFYKFFGGGKFSACGIGSKVDDDDEDSSSESESGEDYYHRDDHRERIFATESNHGSETEKKFRRDEKISRQSRLPISISDIFSKRNSINFNFDFDFNFNFIKSRICKGKNGDRERILNYDQNLRENESATRLTAFGSRENLKRLLQIPSRERKQMRENSRAVSYHEDDENGEQLWQKRILMGEKCKPLMNSSVSFRYDRNGMLLP